MALSILKPRKYGTTLPNKKRSENLFSCSMFRAPFNTFLPVLTVSIINRSKPSLKPCWTKDYSDRPQNSFFRVLQNRKSLEILSIIQRK